MSGTATVDAHERTCGVKIGCGLPTHTQLCHLSRYITEKSISVHLASTIVTAKNVSRKSRYTDLHVERNTPACLPRAMEKYHGGHSDECTVLVESNRDSSSCGKVLVLFMTLILLVPAAADLRLADGKATRKPCFPITDGRCGCHS